jgi:hypothetical protein
VFNNGIFRNCSNVIVNYFSHQRNGWRLFLGGTNE